MTYLIVTVITFVPSWLTYSRWRSCQVILAETVVICKVLHLQATSHGCLSADQLAPGPTVWLNRMADGADALANFSSRTAEQVRVQPTCSLYTEAVTACFLLDSLPLTGKMAGNNDKFVVQQLLCSEWCGRKHNRVCRGRA